MRTAAFLVLSIVTPTLCAQNLHIQVGIDAGDLRGRDHRVLQAAIDYAGNLGGGTVEILPGRYELRNAIHLRTGVHLRGTPGKTILALQGGGRWPLVSDAKSGSTHVSISGNNLQPGDGIFVQDLQGHGFQVTTATVVKMLPGNVLVLDQPLVEDYSMKRKAAVRFGFSGIHGAHIRDASVEGFTILGNLDQSEAEYLGGCRGAGIYLHGCRNVVVRDCIVRKFHGDGISFQKNCRDLLVEKCLVEENGNAGLHPGSDSTDSIVRNNIVRKNGYVGLFVCVGVQRTRFEKNHIHDNGGCGISIGENDTDNRFVDNRVLKNAEMAVLFRRDKIDSGAHRNVFEGNVFADNLGPRPQKSNSRPESAGQASVVIEGTHEGLVFRNNRFEFAKSHAGPAVLFDKASLPTLEKNQLSNVQELRRAYEDR